MPFVQRDTNGLITGLFANKQNGYAEEYLPETNQDVLAFRAAAEQRLEPAPKPQS